MPGTVGSMVGLVLGFIIISFLSVMSFALILGLVFVISYISVTAYTKCSEITGHDPKEVIIDEVMGQLISMTPLVFFVKNKEQLLVFGVCAFILFRFFDILKPWPIIIFDRIKTPLGVILDDIAAGILTSVVLYVVIIWVN